MEKEPTPCYCTMKTKSYRKKSTSLKYTFAVSPRKSLFAIASVFTSAIHFLFVSMLARVRTQLSTVAAYRC